LEGGKKRQEVGIAPTKSKPRSKESKSGRCKTLFKAKSANGDGKKETKGTERVKFGAKKENWLAFRKGHNPARTEYEPNQYGPKYAQLEKGGGWGNKKGEGSKTLRRPRIAKSSPPQHRNQRGHQIPIADENGKPRKPWGKTPKAIRRPNRVI